jgi:hypothetical protein
MATEDPERSPVEAVREELRRLGYLATGLDRFVLEGAGARSVARACARAAFRVGLAGGLLFGLAGALAAVGLDRRLLRDPRDLAVLAFYLVAAAAVGVGVLAFVGGLAAAVWARRLERPPGPAFVRNLGLLLAVTGLLYSAFWIRTHLAAAPLLAQAGALLLSTALCLALGRFGTLAAVAVLAAGGMGGRLPEAAASRHQLRPALLLLAALVFGGVFVAASLLGRHEERRPPDFAVVPTGVRVRVVGIDGLERRMTEQMLARGEMPHLAALLARGASGRLAAEPERVPAIVWTTIATGRGPEAHGIRSTGARRVAGLRTALPAGELSPFASALASAADLLRLSHREPPSAVLRGVKAFWNVASEKGLRVGVVNWWASWPAEAVSGYLVSDRAFFKLEKGGPPEREVFPPEDFEKLLPLLAAAGDAERARRLDRFHASAARLLRAGDPPDLEALYFPGLDIFVMQKLGGAAVADLAGLDERVEAVRDGYRFVDRLLGELTAGEASGEVLLVVADPGRLAREAAQAPEGTLVLAGGPVRRRDLGRVSSRDVAPTVLHLAGLPKSQELEGRVLEEAFDPGFLAAHPVRAVAAYGRRPQPRRARSAFDRDMLEELKALGYVQ